MSIKVMTWVWDHSLARGSQHHVLLAIADCASDDGSNAYPSLAELMRKTRLSERAVQYAIKGLVALGELFVSPNGGPKGCNRYRVVMTEPPQIQHPADFAPPQDVHPRKSSTPQDVRRGDADLAPGTVPEPSKKISSSKRSSSAVERADVEGLCRHLADRIEANGSKRPVITAKWRDAARLLLDRDARTVEQVTRAIDWCQDDDFWRANVLSMPKLREQYDRLRLAAQRAGVTRGAPHKPFTNPTDPNAYYGDL